jgi:hypothetical protein
MRSLTYFAVDALSGDQVACLTTSQINCLTTKQFSSLSSQDINALSTNQIFVLSTSIIHSLSNKQIHGITTADWEQTVIPVYKFAVLTTNAISAISVPQAQSLSYSNLNILTIVQFSAFSVDVLKNLLTSQLNELSPTNMLKVVEINVSTVPDAFISNITINQIDQLNNNTISKLLPNQIELLNSDVLDYLFTSDRVLSSVLLNNLTLKQLSSIPKESMLQFYNAYDNILQTTEIITMTINIDYSTNYEKYAQNLYIWLQGEPFYINPIFIQNVNIFPGSVKVSFSLYGPKYLVGQIMSTVTDGTFKKEFAKAAGLPNTDKISLIYIPETNTYNAFLNPDVLIWFVETQTHNEHIKYNQYN